MKWHDDNRAEFEEHCLLAAINQGFKVGERHRPLLAQLELKGYVESEVVWFITDKGKSWYDKVAKEINYACERENKEKGSD